MSKPSRPSPRIRLNIAPPLAHEVFSKLLKAIGQAMDDLQIPHESSNGYEVRNAGDIVSLYDPTGAVVKTFDLARFRPARQTRPLAIDRNRSAGAAPLAMDRVRSVDEAQQ